jgi:hypothetical protein
MRPVRVVRAALLLPVTIGFLTAATQGPAAPQGPTAPQAASWAAEATAKIQAGNAQGAVALMKEVTAREPYNARAWRLLGFASLKAKEADGAVAAYERSLELEPAFPPALFNLGAACALKGDRDGAVSWLAKAAATRKVDMTAIDGDAAFAEVRDDPRVRALLPTAEDFAHPFVEAVTVLREWDGEAKNDQFGWIARNIGDVDGDGASDLVTSAPTKEIDGTPAGRVYVYSSKSGRLLWTADGRPGDQVGTGVEGAGDTNHDGVPDVVAGAPGGGRAYVYAGRDGKILRTLEAENRDDDFGRHASGAGDVDRDGYADLIVGAPGNNAGGKGAGRAYVYSGRTGRVLLTLTGERDGDAFGSTVAGWADAHRLFLVVGAPGAGPQKRGRTYVYDALSTKPKFVIEADDTGNALGMMFVSVPGDLDGDHVPDVYASDWSNGAKGDRTGRIYVHSGRTGRRLLTLTGETAGEGFGIGPAAAGDVDGDGRADLIVGAWQYGGAAVSGGRATLYSGKDGRLVKTYTCKVPGDTFGFDAVGMGDVDGDGTIDFLITSAWSGIHGYRSGRVFLISSGIRAQPPASAAKSGR